MKIPTQDIDAYNAVKPLKVAEYLKHKGWQEVENLDDKAIVWEYLENSGKRFSVLLPLSSSLPDYTSRMYEVFKTLEVLEKRSQIELFNDLVDVSAIASEKAREILNLKFDFSSNDDLFKNEASAKHLGVVLESLQNLLDSIGQVKEGRPNPFGKIAKEITDRTKVSVIGTFKGSFGIRLALSTQQQLNLIEPPLAEQVVEEFIAILSQSDSRDFENLSVRLNSLQKRSAVNYRKFLLALVDSDANICLDWGSPNLDKGGSITLSSANALATVEVINRLEIESPQEYEVRGELLSASQTKKTFEIRNIEDNAKLFGKISDDIMANQSVELTLRKLYNATIREMISINPTTGEGTVERTLIFIQPWQSSSISKANRI